MGKGLTCEPTVFRFSTRLNLTELTGLKAQTLTQLAQLIREVPGSSIYHHMHKFLQMHEYLSPEPPNDFAYWVTEVLGEDELGERLASIDTIQFKTIRSLRERITDMIDGYLKSNPYSRLRFAREDEAFYFLKSRSFVFPTKYSVSTLADFADVLEKVTTDSIYFHIFEARLRLEKGTNDLSYWLETGCKEKELADQIAALDPYTYTMEDLRRTIIRLVRRRLTEEHGQDRRLRSDRRSVGDRRSEAVR